MDAEAAKCSGCNWASGGRLGATSRASCRGKFLQHGAGNWCSHGKGTAPQGSEPWPPGAQPNAWTFRRPPSGLSAGRFWNCDAPKLLQGIGATTAPLLHPPPVALLQLAATQRWQPGTLKCAHAPRSPRLRVSRQPRRRCLGLVRLGGRGLCSPGASGLHRCGEPWSPRSSGKHVGARPSVRPEPGASGPEGRLGEQAA